MLGERIRQARLLAGLTQETLADLLTNDGFPATKAVISKYENNKSTPQASLLLEMTRILGVSTGYLLHEPETGITWLAYRKHRDLPGATQELVKGYSQDVAQLHEELHRMLYPDQACEFPEVANVSTFDQAEAVATNLRSAWGLGNQVIDNLTQLAEQNGVIVIEWKRNVGHFDGLSGWSESRRPVTVVNTGVDVDRRRFNLAHELGHLLMETTDEFAESLAHRFAGAFLVPAEVAYRELGRKRSSITLAEFGTLKRRYGLSIQGWIYRATDLEIISAHFARTLWREINVRGWKKAEPFAYVADEEPVLLNQMILHAIAEGLTTADRVQQVLPDFVEEIPVVATNGFPSPMELLAMSSEEREQWLERSFEIAEQEEIETFDAFGEEEF